MHSLSPVPQATSPPLRTRRRLIRLGDGEVRIRSLATVAELQRLAGPLYLRYSEGGASDAFGRSRDGESGCLLPGLSASPLFPEPWWDRTVEEWVARQLCQYAHFWGGTREGWIVTGREVGRGPDCEPLLTDVRTVAVLCAECLEEASAAYRAVLVQGRR